MVGATNALYIQIKVAAAFAVWVSALVGAAIPLMLASRRQLSEAKRRRMLALLDCLAAGVFLSGGLVHLMPDSDESLEESLQPFSEALAEYPVASVLVCTGFFIVLWTEKILLDGHDAVSVYLQQNVARVSRKDKGKSYDEEPSERTGLLASVTEGEPKRTRQTSTTVRRVRVPSVAYAKGLEEGLQVAQEVGDATHADVQVVGLPEETAASSGSVVMPFILLLVLSVHASMAGLAIGSSDLEPSAFLAFTIVRKRAVTWHPRLLLTPFCLLDFGFSLFSLVLSVLSSISLSLFLSLPLFVSLSPIKGAPVPQEHGYCRPCHVFRQGRGGAAALDEPALPL